MRTSRINLPLEEILKLEEKEPEHYNFKSKVGQTFGQLDVLFYSGRNSQGVVTYVCKCSCGYYTRVIGSNLRTGEDNKTTSCGCYRDKLRKTIDEDIIQNRIDQVYALTEYEVLDSCGGGFDHVWDFKCQVHGKFSTTYGLVVHRGTQCPSCAITGFKPNNPGFFYLNSVSKDGQTICFKYGITNKSVQERLIQIQSKTEFVLENIFNHYFEIGRDALNLETSFSREFGKKFLTKLQMPSGFTETIDPALLNEALKWLNKQFN